VFLFFNIVHRISRGLNWLGVAALVGMMVLVASNVIIRFFGGIIPGTYELVEIMAAVLISFALIYAALTKTHIVIKLLVSRLPQRAQAILGSITSLFGIVTWALLAGAGAIYAREQWLLNETTDMLELPIVPFRYVLVFALIILCLVLLADLSSALRAAVRK
jgi:TRAP-type C4-dicarboxylate transport system permease small subunit